ncbi:MAG: signal peptidase II, partial [Schaalia hyovaginalis]|uniref:signal peptidase II n=1 Tax=Schaalia hyovaginalis TaxID=29316 RepID=UPI002A90E51B
SGAAFSLGASSTWIFTILALVIIGVLFYALVRAHSMRLAASIGLLLGGAIGNLIDRLIQPPSFGQGHVIDFIDYAGFFVGNVADIWIVLGAAWLAIEMILGEKTKHE